MNVLIISQCQKSALTETRRILDQFAERKGERTWQTAITAQGLAMLRKLLRKTARRNTAVACHWMKTGNRSELLWIVGNISQFNEDGVVPTNITSKDILRNTDENQWHTLEDISILAGIAGLFHDFGKANNLFQQKLKSGKNITEPYRHEWVSLRLFEAFVKNLSDEEWLTKLAKVSEQDEKDVLINIVKDSPSRSQSDNPFSTMHKHNLAKVIGWLIVSHHRLPKFPKDNENRPRTSDIDTWMTGKRFNGSWNSIQCNNSDWSAKQWADVWEFKHGTPLLSKTWQKKAHNLAQRALKRPELTNRDWFEDRISLHLSRMVLMLADHHYSSLLTTAKWQDLAYKAYANTDRKTSQLKQKLDEHNVGVGHNAAKLAKILPKIRGTLPAITRHKGFKKRSESEKFRWQDKAYDLSCGVRLNAAKHGFFGINMASTGCGKTFANGRIMYGLADEKIGCRFSVALGLRALTLQTGDALRDRLQLNDDDLAVLIGSQAVQQLHEFKNNPLERCGSESAEDFFTEEQYVSYEGSLDDGRLSKWLNGIPKLCKLLSAPILVSTIDHLIPATEGERGGKQIAPMLRLLTSDLVLDEPDDFDLDDVPALTRLVNWAGLLGSRVLLSSATLPPTLIKALFEAYTAGRKQYQHSIGEINLSINVCCAWFDEHNVEQSNHADIQSFMLAHTTFVDKRIQKINVAVPLRIAKLLPMNDVVSNTSVDVVKAMAQQIHSGIFQLHDMHHQINNINGKKISVGLVRMANINPLVAVAMQLLATSPHENYRFHFCIYHSQYPLAVRSFMERQLDAVLNRHNPDELWQRDTIKQSLLSNKEENHVYIVLATSVAEVGRDHDYDWAIAEPSSMRSLIQLSGRIQRHREQSPNTPNLLVLSKNYCALKGKDISYTKPGFEGYVKLSTHDLNDILSVDQLKQINSIPRIKQRAQLEPSENLVDLEHHALESKLFGPEGFHAALWWGKQIDWCAELQRHTPFRGSEPEDAFILFIDDVDDEAKFIKIDERGDSKTADYRFDRSAIKNLTTAPRVNFWFNNNFNEIIIECATRLEIDIAAASKKFGEIRLPNRDKNWSYHPMLGVFHELN